MKNNRSFKLKEPLFSHKKGEKIRITDEAINKVYIKEIFGLTSKQVEAVIKASKEILRYARDYNDDNEVACAIDLTNNNKRTEMVKGDINTINLESSTEIFHMYRTYETCSIIICHNHPGLSYFSTNDIEEFLARRAIKTMTIITNNGKLMYISKTSKYNGQEIKKIYKINAKRYPGNKEADKLVREFLRSASKRGIKRG